MDQQQGWTLETVQQLREMAKERIPAETMSLKLKRPVDQIRAKLAEIGAARARDSGWSRRLTKRPAGPDLERGRP